MALSMAREKTNNIYCICSGGKLKDLAIENNYGLIEIPSGMPPRGAFGYSFPQLVHLFNELKLVNLDLNSVFNKAIDLLESNSDAIKTEAMNISKQISDKRIVIYSESNYEGVSVRFRQQVNENSKKLCWHHVFPEMNHNELVGWKDGNDDIAVVMLRNNEDFSRNQTRMDLCKGNFPKTRLKYPRNLEQGKQQVGKQSLFDSLM